MGRSEQLVGLHTEPLGYFSTRLQRFERILHHNGIQTQRVCSSDLDFWDTVPKLDALLYVWGQWDSSRFKARAVIPIVEEEYGVPCFPNVRTCWSFDDKIRQFYQMKAHGFPFTETWVFWEEEKALRWAETAELPLVFKLIGGAGSRNVILVESRSRMKKLIKRMFGSGIHDGFVRGTRRFNSRFLYLLFSKLVTRKRLFLEQPIHHMQLIPNWIPHRNYVLFQEFLPGNSYDTRVTTIGDRAFAFRRWNREGDFRASGSGGIDRDPEGIDLRMVEKALEISGRMKYQTMTYDFLYGKDDQFTFCEMSYGYDDSAVQSCPGYWTTDLQLIPGHFWPQYLILKDLLNLPELKQPGIDAMLSP